MAGIRCPPEDSDLPQARVLSSFDLISDDDRSIATDSWSIKSEYGSTVDDEQRTVEACDVLSASTYQAAAEYTYDDKEEPDDVEPSVLGLQSYWDDAYAVDLTNFHEHGLVGEVWFGVEIMDVVATWTKELCIKFSHGSTHIEAESLDSKSESDGIKTDISGWSVLDIGTGNGLLLKELSKQGFSDLTGADYSAAAIELARNLAIRDGYTHVNFLVDNILETKLERQFQLVMDKGTLDAIGLHPDGPFKRNMYWDSVVELVAPGGILVITSCNSTKDELIREMESFNQRKLSSEATSYREVPPFQYVDHVRTYPTFMFGGVEGCRVATVAFLRN